MANTRRLLWIFLALTACGSSAEEPGPGEVSVEDARALDEAAAKLDASENQSGTAPRQ